MCYSTTSGRIMNSMTDAELKAHMVSIVEQDNILSFATEWEWAIGATGFIRWNNKTWQREGGGYLYDNSRDQNIPLPLFPFAITQLVSFGMTLLGNIPIFYSQKLCNSSVHGELFRTIKWPDDPQSNSTNSGK